MAAPDRLGLWDIAGQSQGTLSYVAIFSPFIVADAELLPKLVILIPTATVLVFLNYAANSLLTWPIRGWMSSAHKLFMLSGRTYLQSVEGGRFTHVEAPGLENSHYGQSPLSVDLDGDGKPDLL